MRAAVEAGIDVSPRKAVMLLRLLPALEIVGVRGLGSKVVYLQHSFATTPQDVAKIGEALQKHIDFSRYAMVEELLSQAEQELARKNFGIVEDLLRKIEKLARELPDESDRETYLEAVRRIRSMIPR